MALPNLIAAAAALGALGGPASSDPVASDGQPRRAVPVPWTGKGGSPVRRNAPCPCGSGKKFKVCCRLAADPRGRGG